ncbi:MAG: M20 family metallo-hydrolase [Planctomycetota bacterium]
MSTTTSEPRVNAERLYASLQALGQRGAYDDEQSGLRGVNRLALTPADGEGRRFVVERMRELGLEVRIDRIGNVYGRRPGREPGLAPVLVGSHIDSVATAGIFDGCLGVLGGLEVAAVLAERGIETRRPFEVAFFSEEEGARFGTDMLGSAVATGRIALEQAWELRDRDGKRVRDELEAIGFLGDADPLLERPHAYLEVHIEQGPTLAARGLELGVVTGVQAISWHELTIVGKSAHAGTTPMELRADAGLAAARIAVELRRMTSSGEFGPLRATMGVIRPQPGLVNVIAGRCAATVDLRNPIDDHMRRAEAHVKAFYERVAAEEGVHLSWRQTARTETVEFDGRLQARIAAAAKARGLRHAPIVSGAGHDAQELARLCPAAMIFVPGENEGISHNPRELSTPKQCADGVEALLRVALELLNE